MCAGVRGSCVCGCRRQLCVWVQGAVVCVRV